MVEGLLPPFAPGSELLMDCAGCWSPGWPFCAGMANPSRGGRLPLEVRPPGIGGRRSGAGDDMTGVDVRVVSYL